MSLLLHRRTILQRHAAAAAAISTPSSTAKRHLNSPLDAANAATTAAKSWKRLGMRRFFTTTSTMGPSSSSNAINPNKMIGKTIYKQLLRWSKSFSETLPLDPMPPLTLQPPRISQSSLEELVQWKKQTQAEAQKQQQTTEMTEEALTANQYAIWNLLPSNASLTSSKLVLPLETTKCIQDAIRLVYALNHSSSSRSSSTMSTKSDTEEHTQLDPEVEKDQVAFGFEVIKSLHQLGPMLQERQSRRDSNWDRTGVSYGVGQVVQHTSERWRAIVLGWSWKEMGEDDDTSTTDEKSSLTTKGYPVKGAEAKSLDDNKKTVEDRYVEYRLLLDEGDASLSKLRVFGSKTAKQSDLELVADPSLKRVRNRHSQHSFERFDVHAQIGNERGRFIPRKVLQYEYPMDFKDPPETKDVTLPEQMTEMQDLHTNAKVVIQGVRSIAEELKRSIQDISSSAQIQKLSYIGHIEERLDAILEDKLNNQSDSLLMVQSPSSLSSQKLAIQYLEALLNVVLEIMDVMYQRRTAEHNKHRTLYKLGSIVKHKKYNFRGVIVGWDAFPRTDVSRWDGLQHIEGNVTKMPFYHVMADINDTATAFGHERPTRYVVQENLELCPENERVLEVYLNEDDGWNLDSASEGLRYIAPDNVKFVHAEELQENDEVVSQCMNAMVNRISHLFQQIRDGCVSNVDKVNEEQTLDFSMDNLLMLLKHTDNLNDALIVEEGIKEIWKVHGDEEMRWSLEDANAALLRGDKSSSLAYLDKIVQKDSSYFEAWNKKATCHYLLGDTNMSIETAHMAKSYNANHFQALSGLGLVHYDASRYKSAAKFFRKSLRIDPWSPVSSRLLMCLDMLERLDLDEGGKE